MANYLDLTTPRSSLHSCRNNAVSINIVLLQAHMYTYLHMVCTEANILIKRSMYTLEGNIGYQVKLLSTILQPVLIKKRLILI